MDGDASLEIWGGLECTLNRVKDAYFNQLSMNGHDRRPEDIELFSDLGIKTIRYPFLWEQAATTTPLRYNWAFHDERMARLQSSGLQPIAGFVHHGSGPPDTSLLDPQFGEKLAHYAASFAARYPSVENFTPVNEPLTTARFSGLYGLWYPHKKDNFSFAQALVNQCRAVTLSMLAIRKINSRARLVQTEDSGKTTSTEKLRYQADFENERRWSSFDLISGKLSPTHPFYRFLLASGISKADLHWFLDHPCPPDLVGLNHYLLSNRYLDENIENFPEWSRGGNGRHRYADVEAVRMASAPQISIQTLLQEAWDRYHLPLAITEVHLDCGREDQMRWLNEIWEAAKECRQKKIDVRAVTAWGLLGHYDWHCFVTRCEGYYESGVFDLRSPKPRATALSTTIRSYATRGYTKHPLLETRGWWARPERFTYGKSKSVQQRLDEKSSFRLDLDDKSAHSKNNPQPLLIMGGHGLLGQAFGMACAQRGIYHCLVTRAEVEATDERRVKEIVERAQPWALVNATGFSNIDSAEDFPEICHRDTVVSAKTLARVAAVHFLPMLTFSSAYVFDGSKASPYTESDPTSPLSVLGRAQVEAENWVKKLLPQSLIVRSTALFGPRDEKNPLSSLLIKLSRHEPVDIAHPLRFTPTFLPEFVDTCLNLLIDGERGLWHLSNRGEVTWFDVAREVARRFGYSDLSLAARPLHQMRFRAPRPLLGTLTSEKGTYMRPLAQALDQFTAESPLRWFEGSENKVAQLGGRR